MTRQIIIERTLNAINHLPDEKAEEISDFADFVFKRYEEESLSKGIQKITAEGKSFEFLAEEKEIYSVSDFVAFLKKKTKTKSKLKTREYGFAKGKIKLAADFDEPIDDFKNYM